MINKKLTPVEILKIFGLGKPNNYWEYSKDGIPFQKKEPLTDNIIQKSIRGEKVLGSSPFVDDIYVQWGLIDVDSHIEDNMSEEQKEKVVKNAEEDSKKLIDYFVKNNYPLYVNASGGGIGKHIRLYGKKILAKDMRAFLYKTCLEVLGHSRHEIFPKQNDLNKNRPYGNQAKVLLGIHPKSKKRTDLIIDNKQLDILKSLEFLNDLFNNFESYKKIVVNEKDYKLVESVDVADISGLDTDVPEYCGFIEKVASKKLLISGAKQKHPHVDPNIAAYTYGRKNKQEVKEGYMKNQNRNHTALDNWCQKWPEGKPQFSCGQIISYLINSKDENCNEGLKICRNCPKYKKYIEDSINTVDESTHESIKEKKEKDINKNSIYVEINEINTENDLIQEEQVNKIIEKIVENKSLIFIDKCREKIRDRTKISNEVLKKLIKEEYEKKDSKEKKIINFSKKHKESDLKNFIFDDDKVFRGKTFSMFLINKDTFAYGIKLPRDEDIVTKEGKIMGREQIWRPVIIQSNNTGEIVSERFKEKHKIFFESIPTENNLNWGLKSIKEFTDSKSKKINGKALFNKIKGQYEKFCYFREKEWYSIHPLWDMGTYIFILFSHYPLFEMNGLKNTAKSKVMLISSYITFNSTIIMVNPTEATIFRMTEELRPTKYIDEAENLLSFDVKGKQIEDDPRIQLINESYHRGGKVPRIEKVNDKFVNKWYNVYSPTMIGSIKGLTGATETRAITNIMTKNPKNDKRGDLNVEDFEDDSIWEEIRDELRIFTLQNWKGIIDKRKEIDSSKIKGRNKQLWLPLLSIAKFVDEKMYEEVKKFAEEISEQRVMDNISEDTLDFFIIQAILQKLTDKKNATLDNCKIYISDLSQTVRMRSDWSNLNNKTVSTHLDRLGFKRFRHSDTNKGSFIELNYKIFKSITEPVCPQLFGEKTDNSNQNTKNQEIIRIPKADSYSDLNTKNTNNTNNFALEGLSPLGEKKDYKEDLTENVQKQPNKKY